MVHGLKSLACAALLAAIVIPAGAETLEDAKALSGLKFGETAGIPNLAADAVDASRGGAKGSAAALLGVQNAKRSKKMVFPPALSQSEREHGAAATIGAGVGLFATVLLAAASPVSFFLQAALFGALITGVISFATGARGRTLADRALMGAVGGMFWPVNIGSWLGSKLSHGVKKLARKE